MAHREGVLALLLDNGFPPDPAARSYTTVARYVLGFAVQLTADNAAGPAQSQRLIAGP